MRKSTKNNTQKDTRVSRYDSGLYNKGKVKISMNKYMDKLLAELP